MKHIALTNGGHAMVSDEDFEVMSVWRWQRSPNGYAYRGINGKTVLMHRMIAGTPDGLKTDHINCNKLDNRRENLRICTHAQNKMNVGITKFNTSGFKGVCLDRRANKRKFRASIRALGKHVSLGRFETAEEAGAAYIAASKKYFGEFARGNL